VKTTLFIIHGQNAENPENADEMDKNVFSLVDFHVFLSVF